MRPHTHYNDRTTKTLQADVDLSLKEAYCAVETCADATAGDVEEVCCLSGGEAFVHAQLDHLAVRVREK